MNEILELLTVNFIHIGFAMGLLAISWISNFCLSTYYNIGLLNEHFEWTRLWAGFLKLFIVVLGTGFLVVSITLVPVFLNYVGLVIPEEFIELFSILAIVALFTKSIYIYVKQAYDTLNGILDFKN